MKIDSISRMKAVINVNGGQNKCSELINLKSVIVKWSTVSVKEWLTETAVRFFHAAEQRAESSLHTDRLMPEIVAIKQNVEFHRAYSRGKSKAAPALVTYALKTRNKQCRVGITTSKKIGIAVERNRCRRVIRAAFSSVSEKCAPGWDLIFVARFKTKQIKSTELAPVMEKQLRELGVIGEKNL